MATRKVDTVFIHHSVTNVPGGKDATVEQEREHMRTLDQIAVNRGFLGISYIFVVFPSGRVWKGRGFKREGAHTYSWNDRAVGFVAVGNYSVSKTTKELLDGFRYIIRLGKERKRIKKYAHLWGHRDVSATDCPGDHLYAKLPQLRRTT